MLCTNPNCECKPGTYANQNPPRPIDPPMDSSEWRGADAVKFETYMLDALDQTLSLRRAGFKTRLAQRRFLNRFDVVTVAATYPDRPNRKERGCEA